MPFLHGLIALSIKIFTYHEIRLIHLGSTNSTERIQRPVTDKAVVILPMVLWSTYLKPTGLPSIKIPSYLGQRGLCPPPQCSDTFLLLHTLISPLSAISPTCCPDKPGSPLAYLNFQPWKVAQHHVYNRYSKNFYQMDKYIHDAYLEVYAAFQKIP